MAGEDLKVRAVIELLLKGKGGEDAKKALDDLTKETEKARAALGGAGAAAAETTKQTKTLGDSVGQLTRKMLGFGALIKILQSIRAATVEWASSTKEGREQLDALDSKMEMVRGRVGELGSKALPALNAVLSFAIKLIQSLGAWWGTVIAGAVNAVTGFAKTVGAAFNFKRLIDEGPRAYFSAIAESAVRGMEDVRFAVEGGVDELVSIWTKGSETIAKEQSEFAKKIAKELREEMIRAAGDNVRERLRLQLEGLEEEHKDAVEEAKKKGEDVDQVERLFAQRRINLAKAAADELRKRAEDERKEAERVESEKAKFARDAEDKLLAAKIAATEEGTDERLKLELEMLRSVRDRALEDTRATEEAKAAIRETFRIAEEALVAEHEDRKAEKAAEREAKTAKQILDSSLALLEARAALEDEHSAERLKLLTEASLLREQEEIDAVGKNEKAKEQIREKWRKIRLANERASAEANAQIAATERQALIEAKFQVAQAALFAAQAIFGENKALASAAVILDTWVSAQKAIAIYGPTPAGYAAAAAAVLFGLGNLAKIHSTSLHGGSGGGGQAQGTGGKAGGDITRGRGFDDPVNDRKAYIGGRRWGDDAVGNVLHGFEQRLRELGIPDARGGSAPSGEPASRGQAVEYHYHGTVIDRRSIRAFQRKLARAERFNRPKRLR